MRGKPFFGGGQLRGKQIFFWDNTYVPCVGSLTFFYQILNIKALNNVKTINLSRHCFAVKIFWMQCVLSIYILYIHTFTRLSIPAITTSTLTGIRTISVDTISIGVAWVCTQRTLVHIYKEKKCIFNKKHYATRTLCARQLAKCNKLCTWRVFQRIFSALYILHRLWAGSLKFVMLLFFKLFRRVQLVAVGYLEYYS